MVTQESQRAFAQHKEDLSLLELHMQECVEKGKELVNQHCQFISEIFGYDVSNVQHYKIELLYEIAESLGIASKFVYSFHEKNAEKQLLKKQLNGCVD